LRPGLRSRTISAELMAVLSFGLGTVPCLWAARKYPSAQQTSSAAAPRQGQSEPSTKPANSDDGTSAADILSDTQGINFGPYVRGILRLIYAQWLKVIPAEARPPERLAGETLIRFSILPTGELSAMHLDGSTHDERLNRAAWGAITSVGKYPPLPAEFHGPNLELRVRFKVNWADCGPH
jgi:TonB family protein